jgi:hypothetical protein
MRLTIFVLAATVLSASAFEARADAEADARAAFQDGVKQFDAGRYQEAADAFREADRLSPSWRIYYNIGQCEAALKRYGDALDAFDRYLAEGGDEIPDARENEVLAEVARLRLKVGSVEVRGEPGITVIIDGNPRGVTPVDAGIRVSGGVPHKLELVRDGAVLLDREFTLGAGQQISVEAPEASAAAPASAEGAAEAPSGPVAGEPPPGEPRRVRPLFVSGIAVGAVGIAMLAVGGGFYGKGKGDYDDYKAAGAGGDETEYRRLKDDVLPVDNAMIVTGFVVGGVLTALGATLLIVDAVKKDEEPSAVAFAPAPGGVALSF